MTEQQSLKLDLYLNEIKNEIVEFNSNKYHGHISFVINVMDGGITTMDVETKKIVKKTLQNKITC